MLGAKYYSKSERVDWKTIHLGAFSIEMPKDYIYYSYQGIDSYVGEIRNDTAKYFFDYGWYSNSLDDYHAKTEFDVSIDTLQGKFARVVLSKNKNGIFVKNIKGENSLCIFGSGLGREDAKYAFKSIDFALGGAISVNFGQNIIESSFFVAKEMFQKNCSPCHENYEVVVSRTTLSQMSEFDELYLRNWIFHPSETLKNNRRYRKLILNNKKFQFSHDHNFFEKSEVLRLVHYIKSFDRNY